MEAIVISRTFADFLCDVGPYLSAMAVSLIVYGLVTIICNETKK